MPLGTGRAGRAGGKAGRTMGTSPLVSGSLCKAGKPVQRAGRFPLEPGKGMVVRMGSCTGKSTAAALFSGERGALEQKKVRQTGQTVQAGQIVRAPSLFFLRIVYLTVYLLIKQRGRRDLWAIFQPLEKIDSFQNLCSEVVHELISGTYR